MKAADGITVLVVLIALSFAIHTFVANQ